MKHLLDIKHKHLVNEPFGRVAIAGCPFFIRNDKYKRMSWVVCECLCGNIFSTKLHSVITGKCQSCGCLAKETARKKMTKHGDSQSRLYGIWEGMLARCNNPNNDKYHLYGGKGIKVSEEWHKYENFRDWARVNGYVDQPKRTPLKDRLTIHRKNSDKPYCVENCVWISHSENSSNNRRREGFIYINHTGYKPITCEVCGKDHLKRADGFKYTKHNYCSKKCASLGRKADK